MTIFSCKVSHPAVTHRGFTVVHAIKSVRVLEIHQRDGAVWLVQLDDDHEELGQSRFDTVEEAMQSAKVDFGVEAAEWIRP